MKKMLLCAIVTFLSCIILSSVHALEWYDDFTNSIDDYNKTITLTLYNGTNKNVTIPKNVNINGDTYKVILSGGVFRNNQTIEKVSIEDGVVAGQSLNSLFYNASKLSEINMGAMDTSQLTDISYAFYGLASISTLDLSKFKTDNVETMRNVFGGGSLSNEKGLQELDISSFDTSKVTIMPTIFDSIVLKKIKIGPKTKFHIKNSDTAQGSPFGRGTWRKLEDGKLYSAIEICNQAELGNAAGTYVKVSDISDQMVIDFNVIFKLGSFNKFKILEVSDPNVVLLTPQKKGLAIKYSPSNGDINLNEYAVLLIQDAVTDVDGNKYDLQVKVENIKIKNVTLKDDVLSTVYLGILQNDGHGLRLTNYNYASLNDIDNDYSSIRYTISKSGTETATSYDLTFKVVDKSGNVLDGSYIFSAIDIDQPSRLDTNTPYKYLDNSYGFGLYSEGISLVSGYDKDTITFSKDLSYLIRYPSDSYRITGTRTDNNSEASEFVVKASSSEFKISWTGSSPAYTSVFAYYQPKNIEIENRNTFGDLIVGSKFELYDSNNNLVGEWTTENGSKSFFLNPGKYTVKQISVPDDYILAQSEVFFVDINDALTYKDESVDKIVIINGTEGNNIPVIPSKGVCKTTNVDGVTHYFDVDGNEITYDEWENKCQESPNTGNLLPYIMIAFSVFMMAGSFIITKRKNVLKKTK